MAKILGLDLGTNSIGWAVVEKEDGKFALVDKGVRIFQRGYGDEHQDSSRAAERTLHRGARKLNYRRKGRKIELLRLLGAEYHPFTEEELIAWHKSKKYPVRQELIDWFKLNPYDLRKKAIDGGKLSQKELGRIFYHLTQRRGFKSNKKDSTSVDGESNGNERNLPKDIVLDREYRAKNGDISLSQKLYNDLSEGKKVRNSSEKNNISRITLEDDFKGICKNQNLNNDFIEDVRRTIFDARPLKSQKGNVGRCVFEKGKPRCPISSVEFEEYRMYSFINNIKVKRKDEPKKEFKSLYEQTYFELDIEKDIVPTFFRQKTSFKFQDIRKKFDKHDNADLYEFNYKDNITVSGCPVSAHLKAIFGNEWKTKIFKRNGVNSKGNEIEYNIFDIWHLLFDHYIQDKKDEPLLKIAKEIFELEPEQSKKLLEAPITQGYTNLSFKAIAKIIPFLKKGFRLDQAIIFANIPTVLGLDKDDDLPDDIYEDILDIFNNYGDEKKRNTIVNDCISTFRNESKNAHSNYQIDDIDKQIIEKQAKKKFGEKTWNDLSEVEQISILDELGNNFENQLRQGGVGGQFIKTESIKQKVKDYLVNNLGIATQLTDKVYHPSAIELYEKVEYNDKGLRLLGSPIIDSIKNPLFMRSMCELRKVVNELLKTNIIDNETQIIVELGRDVNDYNMRKAIERYQRERETENEFYKHLLEEFYKEKNIKKTPSVEEGQRVKFWVEQLDDEQDSEAFYTKLEEHTAQYTKKEDRIKLPQYAIEKYRLWREQKGICPYTHNPIGMADLLNGNKYDFEHTVPLSKSFDNSLANKTIAESHFNRYKKGNKAPFELEAEDRKKVAQFIERWEIKVEELEKRIEKQKGKAKNIQDKERKNQNIQERHYLRLHLKYWKTKVNNFKIKEITDGFKNRQFADISIINKYALMYLRSCFDNVSNISSRFIDEYRTIVGYEKSRNYHTHHTIDAVFCACAVDFARRKPDALAKLERYYKINNQYKKATWFDKEGDEAKISSLKEKLEKAKDDLVPWSQFRDDLENLGNSVLVSRRFQDNLKKQTKKKIRSRGKVEHRAANIDGDGNVLEWKYKTDIHGNKIPVKGKMCDENPDFVLHCFKDGKKKRLEVLGDYPEYSEDTIYSQGYLYVRNKNKDVCYEKEARYTWHNDRSDAKTNGLRRRFHEATLYGALKKPELNDEGKFKFDENNNIILQKNKNGEDIVFNNIRKKLEDARKATNSIVDETLRKIITDDNRRSKLLKPKDEERAILFTIPPKKIMKQVLAVIEEISKCNSQEEVVLLDDKKRKLRLQYRSEATKIGRVRCFKSINPISIKENSHKAMKDGSEKESMAHKHYALSVKDMTYAAAIYEFEKIDKATGELKKVERHLEIVTDYEVADFLRGDKVQNSPFPANVKFKDGKQEVLVSNPKIIQSGKYVLFYKDEDEKEDFIKCINHNDISTELANTFSKRLYRIDAIETGPPLRINFCIHNSAMKKKSTDKNEITIQKYMDENKLKDSQLKLDDSVPWYRITKKNWNFLVEGIDFRISPIGKIERI
ncbi:type II CRISPR RNA-guided endonuclease Cas9 [uncultured Draconibacterium sp.]|uniref:type II CRISPR RNA-guided endonuclease Cas9 n=1 Tax=uncultured Draconibacterium sp. TaxID=1573823 RepID=UPI003260791D